MGEALKERILKEIYFNLNSTASYSGINKILEEAKKRNNDITINDVKTFLSKERTYTLYKPRRKKFKRLKTIPSGLNSDWQCDLCIMDSIKKENDNFAYLLVCIDVLSRKIYTAPTKTKKSEDMIEAFEYIFNKAKVKPNKLYSDSGVEFTAKKMINYFKEKDILKFSMYSPNLHAAVVERANRTIKEKLYRYFSEKNSTRWIEVINRIVDNINKSVNRTIGVKPNSVTYENAQDLYERVFKADEDEKDIKPTFKLNDIVRISKAKSTFDKGYYPNFTDELFKISKVNNTNPPSYRIDDLENNHLKGIFYEQELVLTTKDTTYRIAEKLKTRTRKGIKEIFVRWVGYSDDHNSWIKETDIVN
jgi:hypothetical protein